MFQSIYQRHTNNSQQQPKQSKHIFQIQQLQLPKNLSQFEQNIAGVVQSLFNCNHCFKTEADPNDICNKCDTNVFYYSQFSRFNDKIYQINILKQLEERLFTGIFENEKYMSDLNAFQKIGNNLKAYCGKILKSNDVGFKCYDCQQDSTCIICKECFEKGNHQGHRTVVQKGCSGCCDCGDIEAWKKEGFCSDHIGFLSDDQLNINQINEKQRKNCIQGYKFLFYCIITQIENLIQQTKNGEQIQLLQQNQSIQKMITLIINLIEKLVQKNPVLQNLFYHILCESYFEGAKYNFRHCCPDIVSRVKIGKENTHPLQKCQCTILELLLRYTAAFSNEVQENLKNFFISMFNLYKFKQDLIKSYTKMFNFFYEFKEINKNKEQHAFFLSFSGIGVQLFTSDILAGYVLEQKTENYVIEYFQSKNQKKIIQSTSLDVTEKMVCDQKLSEESIETEVKQLKHSNNMEDKKDDIEMEEQKNQQNIEEILSTEVQDTGLLNVGDQSNTLLNANDIEDEWEDVEENDDEYVDNESDDEDDNDEFEDILEEEYEIEEEDEVVNENEEDEDDDEDEEESDEDEEEEEDDESDDDEENQFSVSQSQQFMNAFHNRFHQTSNIPLYDNKEDKQEQDKINNFENEYYFGIILDRLLEFASYSFKHKTVCEQFLQTFSHIRFISSKSYSLSRLIQNDLFKTKFIEILSKLHHKVETKLRRKFQTIYSENEYALNGFNSEIQVIRIVQKIVSYLHSNTSIDQELFQTIHIGYLKLIIQKIFVITEKNKNKQNNESSSIHIPLHRALIIFLISYFKFNFELITPKSVTNLSKLLNLEFEDFKNFFFEQLKYPLNVASYMKEIDCGVWNYHGEQFKKQAEEYISPEYGFCNENVLFLQFALKIGSTDLGALANIFCNKKEFFDIVNLKLDQYNNVKKSNDFLEKNEKVVGEFLSFIVYTLLDEVALFNLAKQIFYENPDKLKSFNQNTNKFISSYMHQFKTASIQDVQKSLLKAFGKQVDITEILMQVSTFNNQAKKFQLMEKYSNVCEPFLFFQCPEIKSVYHDKIFEKYQNVNQFMNNLQYIINFNNQSKDISIYLLGNYELSSLQKDTLKNIINAKSFRFIEDLIRQPFLCSQLENKKSIAQQYLIIPILKLILIYTQNFDLYNNQNEIDTQVQSILSFLNEYKASLGQEIVDSIQFLSDKLNRTQNMLIEVEQQTQGELDSQKKKEQIQKRQEEILLLFKRRSQTYSENNKQDLIKEKSISIGEECVICKKQFDDDAEYGFGIYCQKTNIYEFSELKGYVQFTNIDQQEQLNIMKTEATKNDFWNIKKGSWQINSCNHHIHKTCYEQYILSKNKAGSQQKNTDYNFEYNCPLFYAFKQSYNTLSADMKINEEKQVNQKTEWETIILDTSSIESQNTEQYKTIIQQSISEYEQMNKKRKCQDISDQNQTITEFKIKKYKDNSKETNFDYLSNQIEIINSLQYETNDQKNSEKKNVSLESEDDFTMSRIENIILNQLRLTDFDCSPNSLASQNKKLSLLRQILYNLNRSLNNSNSNFNLFYTKRYTFCQDFMNLLNQIHHNPSEQPLEKNLIENDLKEMYFKFLFYSINYFNSDQDFIKLIQNTINQVLLAKFVQIHVLIKNRQNNSQSNDIKLSIDEINTFNDNERCQYNVDILQRTWNLLSLFFEFDQSLQSKLNTIFYDSKDEVSQLLKFFEVEIPSKEFQESYINKVIKNKFEFNHLNIKKIVPNNTSFNFISLENKFSDLFKKYQNVKCSNCNDFPSFGNLCVCLICGETLCSISCQKIELDSSHIGNLARHSIELHCNSSLFLDISTSHVYYISYPHNSKEDEIYINNFGIVFKKTSNDWSQFQLENSLLSKMHQNIINLNIVDFIKQNELKNGFLYKSHVY